jgi:hypothetical protein
MGWSLITQPFLMVDEAHNHDFEQFIFLMGGNSNDIVDFDAEVEMTLGDTKYLINYPACIHITPGLMHGPLNVKKVNKPFAFMDIVLNSTRLSGSHRRPPEGNRMIMGIRKNRRWNIQLKAKSQN